MKRKIFSILFGLALVASWSVVTAVLALADAGDTEITANLEAIAITAPTGETSFVLTPTAENSLIFTTGSVTSNVAYDVTAVDKMETSKPVADAGKMLEWTGAAWSTGKLTNVVKVGSAMPTYGQAAADLSTANPPVPISVILIALAGTDVDSQMVVTILTDAADTALTTPGNWYKITITFTASQTT